MSSGFLHPRSARALLAVLLVASVTAATPAGAAPLSQDGTAVVKSVDGPTLMTLKVGKRTLRVTLDLVDAPNPGECGATETTAALKGFVRRAPRKVSYSLFTYNDGKFDRDDAGRLVAVVGYSGRNGWESRDFGNDLVASEWARRGYGITLDTPPAAPGTLVSVGSPVTGERQPPPAPRAPRGVWARCGGRVHAPLGMPLAPAAPAAWSITDRGITTAIGPITLSPDRSRAGALTFAQLAALAPIEVTIGERSCTAYVPSLQVIALSDAPGLPCRDAEVSGFITYGPSRVVSAGGIGTGDDRAAISAAYPLAEFLDTSLLVELSGLAARSWAWQTTAELEDPESHLVLELRTRALPGLRS